MTPFCSLNQADVKRCNMTFYGCVIPSHVTDGFITNTTAFLVQDYQNEMQHELFSYWSLLLLASAACDANVVINSNTVFIRSRQLKQCAT